MYFRELAGKALVVLPGLLIHYFTPTLQLPGRTSACSSRRCVLVPLALIQAAAIPRAELTEVPGDPPQPHAYRLDRQTSWSQSQAHLPSTLESIRAMASSYYAQW